MQIYYFIETNKKYLKRINNLLKLIEFYFMNIKVYYINNKQINCKGPLIALLALLP